MENDRDAFSSENRNGETRSNTGTAGLVISLLFTVGLGAGYAGYIYREKSLVQEVAQHDADLNAAVTQLRGQLDTVTAKLNDVVATQAAVAQSATQPMGATATHQRAEAASNKRYTRLQERLEKQRKELKDTQDSVTKTRSDLKRSPSAGSEELSGTIAKNHDELVAPEKHGERDYFEFDLSRGKQFQHTGPISLSLRRADVKHLNYDLALLVDDNQVTKKRVNLYEPIWFNRVHDPQKMQVVVVKVEKDHVHGYVSAPKYRSSDLAVNSASRLAPSTSSATMGSTSATSNQTVVTPQN